MSIGSLELNAQITSKYIDSVVQASMDAMPQAGIAVAVVKDGKVIHAKGYGTASVKSGAKVDKNTLFSIASNSKAFTTCALGMLVDEGTPEQIASNHKKSGSHTGYYLDKELSN